VHRCGTRVPSARDRSSSRARRSGRGTRAPPPRPAPPPCRRRARLPGQQIRRGDEISRSGMRPDVLDLARSRGLVDDDDNRTGRERAEAAPHRGGDRGGMVAELGVRSPSLLVPRSPAARRSALQRSTTGRRRWKSVTRASLSRCCNEHTNARALRVRDNPMEGTKGSNLATADGCSSRRGRVTATIGTVRPHQAA